MEAVAVQPVSNSDAGRKPVGLEEGSGQAPKGSFSDLVEKLIAEVEKPAEVSSEDVTPELVEGEDSESAEDTIRPASISALIEILGVGSPEELAALKKALGGAGQEEISALIETLGLSNPEEIDASKAEDASHVVSGEEEVAAALALLLAAEPSSGEPLGTASKNNLPKPDVEGLPAGILQLVAEEAPEGLPPEVPLPGARSGAAPADVEAAPAKPGPQAFGVVETDSDSVVKLAGEEASEALNAAKSEENRVSVVDSLVKEDKGASKGKESLLEIIGRGQDEKDSKAFRAKAKSMDAVNGKGRLPNPTDAAQKQGVRAEKGIESSFSVSVESSEEIPQATSLASKPKETVDVGTVEPIAQEESSEAGVKPIKPANDGSPAQTNDRSAEGMGVAKNVSQPQPGAPTQETSAVNRPSTPPLVERIVQKVVDVVQAGGDQKRHEISLQLNPPSLGKVHLRVMVEDSKLHVVLFTTNNGARELVESNASQLKTALHQQGLMLEQFSVGVRSGLAHNMPQQDWFGWQEGFASGSRFQGAGAASNEPAAEPWVNQRRDSVSRIDLFI